MSNIPNKWNEIFGTQSQGKTDWMNSYINSHMNYSSMTHSNYFPDALPIANNKRKTDNIFWIKSRLRINLITSLGRFGFSKKSKTHEILGCSYEEFKLYLESKFESWMTWDNRGLYNGELNYGWDIDHIIPISSSKTENEIIRLSHFTNLQPLCSKINRDIKKDLFNFNI